MNAHVFQSQKSPTSKLTMVTCYDFWSARIIAQTPIDCILVGDSCAMVMHGFPSTVHATLQMMVTSIEAVRRGAPESFIIGDLPFLETRLEAMGELMRAGASAVKLEGAYHTDLIKEAVACGIPIMGHLGLTPQSVHRFGGHKLQSKSEKEANNLLDDALKLEAAGCFGLVLECIPQEVAKRVTQAISIPTIGIGAGPDTDGQVLVLHDLLGMDQSFSPKFLRKYLQGESLIKEALKTYSEEVQQQHFPSSQESYQCALSKTLPNGSVQTNPSDLSPLWEPSTKDTVLSSIAP